LFSPQHNPFGKIFFFNFNFVILKFKGMSDYGNAPQFDQGNYPYWNYNPDNNPDYNPDE
jgi:hypothetical protein